MNYFNEDTVKAREVVAGYKKYNKETVEIPGRYDSASKCRYYDKIKTDPNAGKFVKEFVKSSRKEKQINSKIPKQKIVKEKIIKIKPKKAVQPKIAKVKVVKEKCETYHQIVKLTKEGKSIQEIVSLINISHHNVSWHLKHWNNNKSKSEIKAENDEIFNWIKVKAKLNSVEYCYSAWIGRKNLKMKYNLTSVEIIRRCEDMIKQGLIEEVKEMHSKKYGHMYKIKSTEI